VRRGRGGHEGAPEKPCGQHRKRLGLEQVQAVDEPEEHAGVGDPECYRDPLCFRSRVEPELDPDRQFDEAVDRKRDE
jgi:hypothetical protein